MTELELKEYLEANPSDVYMVTLQKGEEQTTLALDFKITDEGRILVYDNCDINRIPMDTEADLMEYIKIAYSEEDFEEKFEEKLKYERTKIIDGYFYEIGCDVYLFLKAEEIVSIEPVSLEEFIEKVAKEWKEE